MNYQAPPRIVPPVASSAGSRARSRGRASNARRLLAIVAGFSLSAARLAAQAAPPQPSGQTFTLAQSLRYALDHYPTVRAALERLNASVARVSVARAAYLPRLDAVWQTNRATTNNIFGQLLPQTVIPSLSGPILTESSADAVWGSAAGALLSWEPFDFGLRGATVREADAAVQRARAEDGLTRLAVQHAVAGAFFDVAAAQRAVTAAEADVQRREVLARAAHALSDNQLRPGAEASRADAELAAARTRAIQAARALAAAQAAFARMLGDASIAGRVDSAVVGGPADPLDAQSLPPERHPFVQVSQAAVDVASATEAVLARSNLPRVQLQSSISGRGSGANPDGSFDGGADGLGLERANWAAGVQVFVPNLFDFSTLRARRAAAAATTRAEMARHDEALLTVTAEQRAADAQVAAARAIAQNTPVQLAAAQLSEAQARARYDAGLADITEVAEAQNLLASAEFQDAVARLDVWRALLARAVAGGDISSFLERLRQAGDRSSWD